MHYFKLCCDDEKVLLWCSLLLFVGKAVNPVNLQLSWWRMCLTSSHAAQATVKGRPEYTAGNTLRFIEELPSTISDVSVSSAWFSPRVRFTLRSAHADLPCEQQEAQLMSTCLRQHTHACAPMEPLYGSAVVAIPSLTAFLAFGGRAAVDMVDDFSECSERLGRLAWRFQYHTQLTDSVQLDINGSTVGVAHPRHAAVQQPETTDLAILTRDCVSMLSVNADYHCLNQPIVGLLNTAQEPGGEHTSHPHSTTSTFEPAAHAYGAGMHVEWARLIPFGMSDESMQQLLHRSHHCHYQM